jgi:dihydrofolate reductase
MKIILFMAQSVNGMIARKNLSEDFLSNENFSDFKKLSEKCGCFIIGRKTYDAVTQYNEINFDDVNCKKIVVSRKKINIKNFIVAHSPEDALEKADAEGCRSVLLTGGATINSAFMQKNLVDEIIVNVNPFVLGEGIGIFSESNFENNLELVTVKKLREGIVQLRYKVVK